MIRHTCIGGLVSVSSRKESKIIVLFKMGPDTSHNWVVYFIPNKFPKQPRHVPFFKMSQLKLSKGKGLLRNL